MTRANIPNSVLIKSQVGADNGVAGLDPTGSIPASQLANIFTGAVTQRGSQIVLRDFTHVKDFGAKGGTLAFTSGASVSGSTLTDTTNAPFTAASVGMVAIVPGSGVGGRNFATTIASYQSASQVTLTLVPPNASGATGNYQIGWDDTVAIQAALNTGKGVRFDGDNYMWTSVYPTAGNVLWMHGVSAYKIPYVVFLTQSTGTGTIGSLHVSPLPVGIVQISGASPVFVINDGTNIEQVTFTGAASAGATSATVTNQSASNNFAVGTSVTLFNEAMIDCQFPSGGFSPTVSDGVTWNHGFEMYGGKFYGEAGTAIANYTTAEAYRQDAVYLQQWSDIHINNCSFTGFFDAALSLRTVQRMWVSDNAFYWCGQGAGRNILNIGDTSTATQALPTNELFVSGNLFADCVQSPIDIQSQLLGPTTPANIIIDRNIIKGATWAPISLELAGANEDAVVNIQQVLITNNICILTSNPTFTASATNGSTTLTNISNFEYVNNGDNLTVGGTAMGKISSFSPSANTITASIAYSGTTATGLSCSALDGFSACIFVADDTAGANAYTGPSSKLQDIIISGNYCSGPAGLGSIYAFSNRANITNNICVQTGPGPGIAISQDPVSSYSANFGYPQYMNIGDNIVYFTPGSGGGHGVAVQGLSHARVHDNILSGAGASTLSYGVRLLACKFVDVSNNRIEQFANTGIYVDTMQDMKIIDNVIWDCNTSGTSSFSQGSGFYAGAFAGTQNTIENNTIYDDRTTLLQSALTSGTAVTSITVTALTQPVLNGQNIVLVSGTNTQTILAGAAATIGATTIVTSFTPSFSFPVGTAVNYHLMRYSAVAPTASNLKLLRNNFSGAAVSHLSAAANWARIFGNETDTPGSFPASSSNNQTVSASPGVITNSTGYDQDVAVFGGTVSNITYTRNGTTTTPQISAGTNIVKRLMPGDAITVTWSVQPTYMVSPIP